MPGDFGAAVSTFDVGVCVWVQVCPEKHNKAFNKPCNDRGNSGAAHTQGGCAESAENQYIVKD